MHCPSHEVGQDHAKNILKEWRSLSLGRHVDPGTLLDARNRAREQLWRLYPRQGREQRSGGEELGTPDCTGHCWRRALENNAFDRYTGKGLYIWDAPLQGAGVTRLGGVVRRRQRHHSGLWCDVFTTELDVEGGVDGRSLTARKHTLKSSNGLCKPVPDQESGNSFSYLVRGILMDCMATLR